MNIPARTLNYAMHRAKDYLKDTKFNDHDARVLALERIETGLEEVRRMQTTTE